MKKNKEKSNQKKKEKTSVIDKIRKKLAKLPPPKLSAEEEVRRSRTRGLL